VSATRSARRGALSGRAGPSLGLPPLSNVILLEVGVAVALVLLTVSRSVWPAAVAVVVVALLATGLRWHGRWVTQWAAVVAGYLIRPRTRQVEAPPPPANRTDLAEGIDGSLTGCEDARVGLLRLLVPDLVVTDRADHERAPVGLAWHHGMWTAVVLLDPRPVLVSHVDEHRDVPLAELAACLQDRGVVLDGIRVVWHCYPGSSALPPDSPALAAYHDVLGPLPAVARRRTWVAVRLDPRRCPEAVGERGGGVPGAHRALLGAVSRVRGVLDAAGLDNRVLDSGGLLRAGISCAGLAPAAGRDQRVGLREGWNSVTGGGVSHSSYAINGWPGSPGRLDALTSARALSTTLALALSPGTAEQTVGIRGLIRVSARTPAELNTASEQVRERATGCGVTLSPLNGQQAVAVTATLPVGGAA